MEEIALLKPDIICLPEVAPFSNIPKRPPLAESTEEPIGIVIKPLAEYAKRNMLWIHVIMLFLNEPLTMPDNKAYKYT